MSGWHDDQLGAAATHLERANAELRRPAVRLLARLGFGGKAVGELTAATQILASVVQQEAVQRQLIDAACRRLEIVTAGDEQLLDDIGYALETLQAEMASLRSSQDRIAERLDNE